MTRPFSRRKWLRVYAAGQCDRCRKRPGGAVPLTLVPGPIQTESGMTAFRGSRPIRCSKPIRINELFPRRIKFRIHCVKMVPGGKAVQFADIDKAVVCFPAGHEEFRLLIPEMRLDKVPQCLCLPLKRFRSRIFSETTNSGECGGFRRHAAVDRGAVSASTD